MSGVIDAAVAAFVDRHPTAVLGTVDRRGRIRQSVVYVRLEGGRLFVSSVLGRGKVEDVRRTGRASVCVFGHERPFPSVTLEGAAEVISDAAEVGRRTRAILAGAFGPAAPSPTDGALVADRRVILAITIDRAYGASYLPAAPAAGAAPPSDERGAPSDGR